MGTATGSSPCSSGLGFRQSPEPAQRPSYGSGDPSPRLFSDGPVVTSVWPPPQAQHKDDHPRGPSAAEAAGKSTFNWEVMERLTGRSSPPSGFPRAPWPSPASRVGWRTRVWSNRLPRRQNILQVCATKLKIDVRTSQDWGSFSHGAAGKGAVTISLEGLPSKGSPRRNEAQKSATRRFRPRCLPRAGKLGAGAEPPPPEARPEVPHVLFRGTRAFQGCVPVRACAGSAPAQSACAGEALDCARVARP